MPQLSGISQTQSLTFSALGGVHSVVNPADIPQDERKPLRFAQANNAYTPDNKYDIQKRPGLTALHATTINAAGIFTGGVHMGEIADELITWVSITGTSHKPYRHNANPPGAITGGTDFTIGQDNLVSSILFTDGTNPKAIFFSRSRDLPQSITGTPTRTDFTISGTGLTSLKPAAAEVFGRRAIYINCNRDGTVEDDYFYWSDLDNGDAVTDYLSQRDSVATSEKDYLRAVKKYGDVCMLGKLNNVFLAAVTPSAVKPYTIRELPLGKYKGPVSHQGVVEADNRLWWMGQNSIYVLDPTGEIKDAAEPIANIIEGLQDSRKQYTVAGYDDKSKCVLFSVTNSGQTKHERIIAINVKTGEVYPNWTINANMIINRLVSSQPRAVLGGYVGLSRYLDTASYTGNADDQTALIDMDVISPRHHCNAEGSKVFEGVKIRFDLQGSEAVTVQYRLNDLSDWSSFAESPYTIAGTAGEFDEKYFRLMKVGKRLQLRFRNANTGEGLRIQSYTLYFKVLNQGLVY